MVNKPGFTLYRNAMSADDPYDVTTLDRSVILKADLVREQWYNAWIVADNSTDTFDVYISQASGPVGAATSPSAGDKVATGLPFNRATTEALTGGAFFNSLVPAGQNGDGVRAPKAYFDEIWWDGDRGLGSLVSASNPHPADGAGDIIWNDLLLQWAPGDFAHTHNVYVVVEDSEGQQAVAVWGGTVADLMDPTWHEWTIPFSELAGVNFTRVPTLYVGVGQRDNPATGGMGTIWIDEIRVTVP